MSFEAFLTNFSPIHKRVLSLTLYLLLNSRFKDGYKLWPGFFVKTDTVHLITHLVKFLPELSKIKADKN